MTELRYLAPNTLDEAIGAFAAAGSAGRILAGGTDLLVQMRAGMVKPGVIVDIKKIAEMTEIVETADGGFHIGAAVAGAVLAEHPRFGKVWPGVLEAINKRGDQPWSGDDRDILAALADQAAIAVQNARLFQQSDFIAEMVHELRTPLASLRASAALLARPALPPDTYQEIVRTLQLETERLTALTTDFLDLARLESGRTRLEMTRFDVRALLDECVSLIAPRASERAISLTVRPGTQQAHADRDRIKQVLLNLLTNAIKYNVEGGSITVALDVTPANQADAAQPGEMVVISVTDSGPGISAEDQPHIFDKFYRSDEAIEKFSGTGLGLSIVKGIVERHDGRIWVDSQVGKGTTFTVMLPSHVPAPDALAE